MNPQGALFIASVAAWWVGTAAFAAQAAPSERVDAFAQALYSQHAAEWFTKDLATAVTRHSLSATEDGRARFIIATIKTAHREGVKVFDVYNCLLHITPKPEQGIEAAA